MISPLPNAAPGPCGAGRLRFSPPTKKLPWLRIVSGPGSDFCACAAAPQPITVAVTTSTKRSVGIAIPRKQKGC
jgi:hypothetical protein